jgi:hypothetical protein
MSTRCLATAASTLLRFAKRFAGSQYRRRGCVRHSARASVRVCVCVCVFVCVRVVRCVSVYTHAFSCACVHERNTCKSFRVFTPAVCAPLLVRSPWWRGVAGKRSRQVSRRCHRQLWMCRRWRHLDLAHDVPLHLAILSLLLRTSTD